VLPQFVELQAQLVHDSTSCQFLPFNSGNNVDRKREQTLIRLAQRGDAQAFAELYRAHVDQIFRYIQYRVDNTPIAEDLTSDVFVRALEGLADYEQRSVPWLAWLYRIAHARVVDYYRHIKRTGDHEDVDDLEIGTDDDLDASLVSLYENSAIRVALEKLTDEQQQVILMRFVEGHSLEKTAEILDKTTGAIKALQHRALQALSRTLQKQGFKTTND
jgi:RNA polymerase sigma-70 factor (ECF subfamily)